SRVAAGSRSFVWATADQSAVATDRPQIACSPDGFRGPSSAPGLTQLRFDSENGLPSGSLPPHRSRPSLLEILPIFAPRAISASRVAATSLTSNCSFGGCVPGLPAPPCSAISQAPASNVFQPLSLAFSFNPSTSR